MNDRRPYCRRCSSAWSPSHSCSGFRPGAPAGFLVILPASSTDLERLELEREVVSDFPKAFLARTLHDSAVELEGLLVSLPIRSLVALDFRHPTTTQENRTR